MRNSTPLKWTLKRSSTSASVTSAIEPPCDMPPLLTRKSNESRSNVFPSVSRTVAANASSEPVSPTSSWKRDGAAAERLDLRHDGRGLVGVAAVGDDDVDAVAGQVQRGAAADAAVARR